MAYDEGVAQRIRENLDDNVEAVEKKMFGGIAFMVQGNMACGVHGENLIIRLGPERYEDVLANPHARPFDLTGRPMKGWVYVAPAGFELEEDLKGWLDLGIAFAQSLPPK